MEPTWLVCEHVNEQTRTGNVGFRPRFRIPHCLICPRPRARLCHVLRFHVSCFDQLAGCCPSDANATTHSLSFTLATYGDASIPLGQDLPGAPSEATEPMRFLASRNRLLGGVLVHVTRRQPAACTGSEKYQDLYPSCTNGVSVEPYGVNPVFEAVRFSSIRPHALVDLPTHGHLPGCHSARPRRPHVCASCRFGEGDTASGPGPLYRVAATSYGVSATYYGPSQTWNLST